MPTFQIQLAVTLSDDAAAVLAQVLAPALQRAMNEFNERRDARLNSPQSAIHGGHVKLDDQEWLIDSKQVAKLLRVCEKTLLNMEKAGAMPPPVRLGRVRRWSKEVLKKWIDAGCPASPR